MGNATVQWIKNVFPARHWRALRRASNRLRWWLKFNLLRQYGFPITRRPLRALQYILWDPEVESFSYRLANEPELADFLARLLHTERNQVVAWMEEAKRDPVLARDRGFHWSSKRFQPLGNRLMWYPIVRAMKPRLIVEAGVHEGLGTEVLLVALHKNAQEGHPGRLISFDIHEDTGWLVAPHLKENWQFVLESTLTGMEPVLRGQEVDMFIHETLHTEETLDVELNTVLRHAGRKLVVVDSSGMLLPTLRQFCQRHETEHHYFLDEPDNHIVRSYGTGFAIFNNAREHPSVQNSASKPATQHAQHVAATTALAQLCVAMSAVAESIGSAGGTALATIV